VVDAILVWTASANRLTSRAKMANRGLIFIPDISGFSRFVSETEIDHSRLIIQELLEALINANSIGLEISEIEGDAILFYRFGEPPPLEEVYAQVRRMFSAFHSSLLAYDCRKYCQCEACVSAVALTLKVITHYGEFTGYSVKSFNKLIGRDIIVAHELLKNDIEHHEYWLVTQSLLGDGRPDAFANWMEWNAGAKQTQLGTVPFQYTLLRELRSEAAPEPIPQADLGDRALELSVSREYDTDIITLFHASGDLNHRPRWREGVVRVEEVAHLLPRVGMRCCCISKDGGSVVYTNSYQYRSDRIEFTETDEVRSEVTRYLLEAVGTNRTRLTLEYHLPKGVMSRVLFRLLRKEALQRSLQASLENLVTLVDELDIPSAVH
jgi:hypothetical protein